MKIEKTKKKGKVCCFFGLWPFSCDENCENCADYDYDDDDGDAYVFKCGLCGNPLSGVAVGAGVAAGELA